jgi:DNA-binding LacI/PurR family transcriptional regulator
LGVRAAELLFAEIEALDNDAAHEHRQIQFVPDLVVRRSIARAASRVVVS